MVSEAAAWGIFVVALGMVLSPGPNTIYLVSRSISQGWRAGLVSLLGTLVGFVVYMTMANVGVAAVFELVPWLFIGLKVAGALYLLYLAWNVIRPDGASPFEARDMPPDSAMKLFRMGLLTNLLNPKSAIMYLALIPQFITPGLSPTMLQGFLLGGIQIVTSISVNGLYVMAAGGIATFLRDRPAWMVAQRGVTGTVLGAVGLTLALDNPMPT
ncbi:LysE family translocator [Stackebrandtia soli]|uniref:LysE family translocator n=1 Tax=Stackebrandtia soli TaxID=1892856 RepID=UPI0039EBB150